MRGRGAVLLHRAGGGAFFSPATALSHYAANGYATPGKGAFHANELWASQYKVIQHVLQGFVAVTMPHIPGKTCDTRSYVLQVYLSGGILAF